ncbi:MAG: 4Fe-4S binding protein [Desulfobacteraceae bacterium]|nr:MAG: 4Fe-4S binding protein [Desulfobacteraceae bacterium]
MDSTYTISKGRRWQPLLGFILVLLLVDGWFFPPLGYFMIFCTVMAMGIGIVKGRHWCDWLCPRGSFWDWFLSRVSRNVKVPRVFRSVPFRLLWLGLLMTVLTINLIPVWKDFYLMGKPFVMLLTVTTLVGLILGVIYHPRIWCMFCPMGTMANWLGRGKMSLIVDEKCSNCGACEKVCRMQIYAGSYREVGVATHGDCLKCYYCVEKCPAKALEFKPQPMDEAA